MKTIQVVDSHTEGEPTRVVIDGGPDLKKGSLPERQQRFTHEFDRFRTAIINEPRGSDFLVGALLCEPDSQDSLCGVIFFNNVGVLGMCGHGTMGLLTTMAHLGKIEAGSHQIETPVGMVLAELHQDQSVSVSNVPSFREAKNISLEISEDRTIHGDIAWGGNWFFLCEDHGEELLLSKERELTDFAIMIRDKVHEAGFPKVDHIELLENPESDVADSRNFVLCPGGAYDRSPCGTGTSAKLACLSQDRKLEPGQNWIQESITGTQFHAYYLKDKKNPNMILPTIRGRAFITSEGTLRIDEKDPLGWGILKK